MNQISSLAHDVWPHAVLPDTGNVDTGCSVVLRKLVDKYEDGPDAGIERQDMFVAFGDRYFKDSALVRSTLAFVYRLVCQSYLNMSTEVFSSLRCGMTGRLFCWATSLARCRLSLTPVVRSSLRCITENFPCHVDLW